MTATPIHDELVAALRRSTREPSTQLVALGPAPSTAPAPAPATPVVPSFALSFAPVPPDQAPAFDDAARAALALADEEAAANDRPRWGTGHLLLGLLRGGDAVADLLHAAGTSSGSARRSVARYEAARYGGDDDTAVASSPGPTPAAATVVDTARAAGRSRGRAAAGTADLLVALLDAPAGAAAGVLATLEVPRDELAAVAGTLAARPRGAAHVAARRWRDPSRLLGRRT